jgi:hypothetical protein
MDDDDGYELITGIRRLAKQFTKVDYLRIVYEDAILADGIIEDNGVGEDDEISKDNDILQMPKICGAQIGKVQIYVDISNISAELGTTINPRELHNYIADGRRMCNGLVVGSFPDSNSFYWERWRQLGYKVVVHNWGREKGVDETLHANIFNGMFSYPNSTMIIVTGDGNRNEGLTNFPKCINFVLANSEINVEQYSWRHRLNSDFKAFSKMYPERYSVKFLDSANRSIID